MREQNPSEASESTGKAASTLEREMSKCRRRRRRCRRRRKKEAKEKGFETHCEYASASALPEARSASSTYWRRSCAVAVFAAAAAAAASVGTKERERGFGVSSLALNHGLSSPDALSSCRCCSPRRAASLFCSSRARERKLPGKSERDGARNSRYGAAR